MNLSKTGKKFTQVGGEIARTSHSQALPQTRTHTHFLHNDQRYCSSFLKGKRQVRQLSGSAAVRHANTRSSSRMRYTHADECRWTWATTAGWRFASWAAPALSPLCFWPALHRGRRGHIDRREENMIRVGNSQVRLIIKHLGHLHTNTFLF